MSEPNITLQEKKAPASAKAGYALFGVSCSFAQMIPAFLSFFMTQSLAVSLTTVSLMIVAVKVIDAVSDIIAGFIIDKTKSPKGKARPWILRMAIPYAATLVLIFCVPASLSEGAKVALVAILYALNVSVFATMLNVSRYAIVARMTLNNADRGTFSILGDGFFGIASTGLMALVIPLSTMLGWHGAFAIFAVIALVACIITYLLCKELPREVIDGATVAQKQQGAATKDMLRSLFTNKYALFNMIYVFLINITSGIMQSGGTYYWTYIMGDANGMSKAMLMLLVFGVIAILLSKFFVAKSSRLLGYATLLSGVFMLLLRFLGSPEHMLASTILYSLMGVFTIQISLMSFGQLTAMASDYGEWKSGTRVDGLTSSVINLAMKIGTAIGTAAFGLLVASSGFVAGGGAQSAETVASIHNSFLVVPAVIILICSAFFFISFRLPRLMPQIRAELNQRHKKEN